MVAAMKNNFRAHLIFCLLSLGAIPAATPSLIIGANQSGPTGAVPPVFGDLKPGPHAVGFRLIRLKDPTRFGRPKRDYFGKPDTSERAILINLHVWYPAADASGAPVNFEQYLYHEDFAGLTEAARRQQRDFARQYLFAGRFSDEVWRRLLDSPMLARRDAREAPGKFPLLLGILRPLSACITTEYLASHGYVVVMVEGSTLPGGRPSPATSGDAPYRNLEFGYAHTRSMTNVDQNHTGTLSYSAFGTAQIIYAMRTYEVDAVVSFESAYFMDLFDYVKGLPGYDVTAMRAPFFHVFRRGQENTASLADFEAMRYSTRYRFLADAPQIRHFSFYTEGMAECTVLGLRPEAAPLLRKTFELTNLYALNFLNAYLKGDAAGLAYLGRDPAANGAPERLITVTEKTGIKPAPTEVEFISIIDTAGLERALAVFKEAKQIDPDAALFRESTLNRVGDQLMRKQRYQEAIEIYRLSWEAYPKSSQTVYNLGSAYEGMGDKKMAVEFYERSLQLVDDDPNQTDFGRRMIRRNTPNKLSALKEGMKD
jgi:tetratricopeptide (TPR) repeat protein